MALLFFISISGDILALDNVSAVAKFRSFLIIGADEGTGKEKDENRIQLLKMNADGSCAVADSILLMKDEGKELDVEGICAEGDQLYVVGSHSSKRKKVKADNSWKKNRETFHQDKIEDEVSRDWLFRLRLNDEGKELAKDRISLRGIIRNDPVLKAFCGIPSKENGVDIEGLAVKDGWLHVGFRGPVFRDNYVPVLRLRWEEPEKYELLYVRLGGRGIRDLAAVSDGFLILAGPVGDGADSYQVYHWNGKDTVPGKDRRPEDIGSLRLLGEIAPPDENSKAEGLTVLEEQHDSWQLVIAYDGATVLPPAATRQHQQAEGLILS
ncbi:MAG: DUF3616 domain-containing protein [Candidatus Electronema sp. V4]|uniref:DUF3616 domain-containing protein n=1 Tax=Candidatus Electronema sp. V4 TaxID=3454756 RepID=UPI00405574DB